ncbi:MAG: S8 family serine peptidase, partial [Chloroflexota bacterium]
MAHVEALGGQVLSDIEIIDSLSIEFDLEAVHTLSRIHGVEKVILDEGVRSASAEEFGSAELDLTSLSDEYYSKSSNLSIIPKHNAADNEIQYGTKTARNGIFVRKSQWIAYDLTKIDRDFDNFQVSVALNKNRVSDTDENCGSLEFIVLVDGLEQYRSNPFSSAQDVEYRNSASSSVQDIQKINILLNNAKELMLKTIYKGPSRAACRYGIWANPILTNSNLLASGNLPNLVKNGSLDSKENWTVSGEPRKVQINDNGSNGNELKIQVARGKEALVSQDLDLTPGKTYLVEAHVDIKHNGPGAQMFISFQDGNGVINTKTEKIHRYIDPVVFWIVQVPLETQKSSLSFSVYAPTDHEFDKNFLKIDEVYVVELPIQTLKNQANGHLEAAAIDEAHSAGLTGKGIGIAVLDTGVEPGALGKDLAASVSFVGNSKEEEQRYLERGDTNGHGTMMASIIGNSNLGGVAYNADIISVKV